MGQYLPGDVLLAPVALDSRSPAKTRPVIVIGTSGDGKVQVCPVSSKPPTDAPCMPLTIDDFATGGLDLFEESYIMTSRVVSLRSGQVIGKRGRLTPDSLAEISGRVPASLPPGTPHSQQGSVSRRKKRS
jgi:mRNA interferase MazF